MIPRHDYLWLRQRIEDYLALVGTPLQPGAFEDHTELLTALGRGPAHLSERRAAIAADIAALVQGLHAAMRDATPLNPAELPTQKAPVYVLAPVDHRATAALEDIRRLLAHWANRWSRYQSAALGPPD